jgi:hypothetical protein
VALEATAPAAAKAAAAKKVDDTIVDMLDAHGEHVKAKKITGGFGVPGRAPEEQTDIGAHLLPCGHLGSCSLVPCCISLGRILCLTSSARHANSASASLFAKRLAMRLDADHVVACSHAFSVRGPGGS